MRILKAGGNAVDAAMATWAVQGEVEPGMTGLGADMFVLIYLAKTGEVKFINGTGFAPQAATIDFYNSKGGIPDSGPLSISVPGAVGGAAMALKKYGTKSLGEVLAQGGIGQDALERGSEAGRVPFPHEQAGVSHNLRDGARVRCDHRYAAGHGFDQYVSELLLPGRRGERREDQHAH